jgi:hypothetical protein
MKGPPKEKLLMRQLSVLASFAALAALVACGDNNNNGPADGPVPADGPSGPDGPDIDAPAGPDAPDIDAMPMVDAGPNVSDQIAAAIATPDGAGLNLPITGATVTFLKPQIGSLTNDPAGFTIQGAQLGPALFIAVDPATLTPPPVVGTVASFTITEMDTVAMQRRAATISGYTEVATGADVGALAQDISAATDVVSALTSYDSEVIDVTGTVFENFAFAGTAFVSAGINTAGISGDANYQLRVPDALRDALDLVNGCMFTLNDTPVGRFNAEAQLAAFSTADISLSGCPAPTVSSAAALSPTSVRVTFDRNILASSVMADGSQFTFDNGLTATAATVSGRTVDVTTAPQTGGTTYTVTVASSVTDLQGTGVGTPNTAMFAGFMVPAVVRVNEVNANIAQGCDLIELRVVTGGSMTGFRLHSANVASDLITFSNFSVSAGDIIVVHLDATDTANCNTGGATQEAVTTLSQPALLFPGNYDTAFDWWSPTNGIAATANVITIYDAGGSIVDAALFVNTATNGSVAGSAETQAAAVAAAMQWEMVGGGVPPGGFVDLDFSMHAALSLSGTGPSATGDTIQRLDNTDDDNLADWNTMTITVQPQTWGALNVGQ